MECLKGIGVGSVAESWRAKGSMAEDEDGDTSEIASCRAYRAQEGIPIVVFLQWKPPEYFKH